ncbi:alkaline phosphatase PhoX [Demequina sp.]|uniref:alkaline phosphatase PhoX n=1 Tax=Demequina sp. TaxID=2050685 RepID=UPI0025BB95C0|nr:alkaline phosphatase PhoX [Demequina sp.]
MHQSFSAVGIGVVALGGIAFANPYNGPWEYQPIEGSAYGQASTTWDVPYIVPEGYHQWMVKDETVLDVYPGVDDLHDMNTQNEGGHQAGRYMYNTYEVNSGGAIAVTNLKTGEAQILAQDSDWGFDWNRLDGIRWTPWNTLLITEETAGGKVYEVFLEKHDPTKVTDIVERGALGSLRHEGIDVGQDGSVYVIDEYNGGSIFRFVPSEKEDLSAGTLYALKFTGLTDEEQKWSSSTFDDKVGAFEWVTLDQELAQADGDAAANAVNATEFGRPEDLEIIDNTLYVANTSEDRVIAVDLGAQTVSTFVEAGLNVPVEVAGSVTGFNSPDNLAEGPDGTLWIVEDNDYSDIYQATMDENGDGAADSVSLFASLKDEGAETTGIYFGKDRKVMYVTVQHPDKDLADGIWAISKKNK